MKNKQTNEKQNNFIFGIYCVNVHRQAGIAKRTTDELSYALMLPRNLD